MKRLLLLMTLFATPAILLAQQSHQVTGIVLRMEPAHHALVVSCDEIPGTMAPMEMSFTVRNLAPLRTLTPGTSIHFTMTARGRILYASDIHPTVAANLESEPMQAAGLGALQSALDPASTAHVIAPGQQVPDFALTDQAGQPIRLSSLAGRVVLLTFGYSRCPNPDYCLRLSNNLARVRDRFRARTPSDLVLLTIAIDPEYDQGPILAHYAAAFKADPASWHFLTGPLPAVKTVAAMFGMNFWRSEGLLTHSLHTVVIDRAGNVAANLEGNHFTVQQLGDLVQTVMDRPR